MIIFIDGADGVGKTTLGTALAKWIGCDYVDVPLHAYIEDGQNNNYNIQETFNNIVKCGYSKNMTDYQKMWLNAIGLIHLKQKYKDNIVVTIRGLTTSHMWNYTEETKELFNFLASQDIGTDYSIALDATDEVRLNRMLNRGLDEEEVRNKKVSHFDIKPSVKHMRDMGYEIDYIDTTNLSIEEVLQRAKGLILESKTIKEGIKKIEEDSKNSTHFEPSELGE